MLSTTTTDIIDDKSDNIIPKTEFELYDWDFIPLLTQDLETLKYIPSSLF